MKVVINTTALSVFGRLKKIHLLQRLLGNIGVLIPEQVVLEYSLIIDDKDKIPSSFKIVEVDIAESPFLGSGENACIQLAKKENAIFVTDDLRARKVAKGEGIKFTGTLGLILAGVDSKKVTKEEAMEVLKMVYEKKLLYISSTLYKELLSRLLQGV